MLEMDLAGPPIVSTGLARVYYRASTRIVEASRRVRHRRNPESWQVSRSRRSCWIGMIGSIRHRGPDATGIHLDPAAGIGLAHARLSIIDLASGGQPMSNHDRYVVDHVQRRDLQLRRAACRADAQRSSLRDASRTPKSFFRCTRRRARTASATSTVTGRSQSGTVASRKLFLSRDRVGCPTAVLRAVGQELRLRFGGEGCA